jgi:hypothetical protein
MSGTPTSWLASLLARNSRVALATHRKTQRKSASPGHPLSAIQKRG